MTIATTAFTATATVSELPKRAKKGTETIAAAANAAM
jgi:hypothetical protein